MLKIVSIDPAGNGATAIICGYYDEQATFEEEPWSTTNFAMIDFRGEGITDPEVLKEVRHRQLESLIGFIDDEKPDVVILENFIMFKQQMGHFGQSFITSELIGALDLELRRREIPVIKPRSSALRKPITEYYLRVDEETGEVKKIPKPRKFKDNLTNKALKDRGLLVSTRYNRTNLVVNGELYLLRDYQIGKKNDHLIMALRHVINECENSKISIDERIENIKLKRYREDIYEEIESWD